MSSLIDGLPSFPLAPEKICIAFYYCDHADKRTLDPVNIYSSLTKQLVQNQTDLPPAIVTMIEESYPEKTSVPALGDILPILVAIIRRQTNVIIFADGLDKMIDNGRKIFFTHIVDLLLNTAPCQLKVFVSSREDTTYLTLNPEVINLKVHLAEESLSGDINSYAKQSIHNLIERRELVLGDCALEETILRALTEGSKGM